MSTNLQAQNAIAPYFSYGKGLGITSPDSLFMLNIRFRIQNRFAFATESLEDLDIKEVEARVRRLRLRFDGFIYNPKLTYVIQLSFSRGDMDFDDTGFPNVVRDAIVLYSVNEHFTIGLGQTKLPGNRQRVNSSGDLQLPDRSIVNSTFNVDRDFGLQFYYNNKIGFMTYVVRGAITSGEGRNVTKSDRGLAYTGRLELLPFGYFTNGGDYFEGDLSREPKPKVSVGLTYSDNENATRTGGQLGVFLPPGEQRDIETGMVDFLLKYNGWALASEYLNRSTIDPLILIDPIESDYAFIYKGHGFNLQGSYLFKNNLELVSRFSEVKPDMELADFTPYIKQYTIGTTKYMKGHRVKLQCDVTLEHRKWLSDIQPDSKNWQVRFQVEAGI
ncbi:porin [Chryseotalea sanaruensis]|uniref:Porin n=2 Tax=Chryseotalea sanaruensis TaxID=2482724 RepID=A0A401UAG2_9BACT|nr:porin [Chryseotalea sanaruensis]